MNGRVAALLALGALLGVGRGAVERIQRPEPVVVVQPGESLEEAILVHQALGAGWARTDPVIRKRLADNLEFAGQEGTEAERVEAALALGMAERDPVVRARLIQRARQALERVGEPTEAELQQWLAENPPPPSRETVYEASQTPLDDLGEPRVVAGLAPTLVGTEADWTGRFGEDFAAGLAALEAGEEATLSSAYGRHRVRLLRTFPLGPPPIEAELVRAHAGWEADQRAVAYQARMAELRARLTVEQR